MRLSHIMAILLLTFFLFLAKGVVGFLVVKNFAGMDLVGNYSFVWLMHKLLAESKVTGWTNLWFAGMPAFTFYPPLFFITAAGLKYLTFGLLNLKMAYKIVVFMSLFLFPLIVYFSFKRMGFKSYECFFISLWSLAFLFLNGIYGGINQTLNFGLVSQMFALNLYFLFLGELMHAWRDNNVSYYKLLVPSLLLGLIVLSHVYVSALAILSVAVSTFIARSLRVLKMAAFVTIVGLLFSSFWWMPAAININYAEPYYWNPMGVSQFSFLLTPFFLFMFLNIDMNDKNKMFFIALFLIVFFLGTQGLPFGKIQYDRFFFFSFLVGSVLAGFGTYSLLEFISKKFRLPGNHLAVLFSIFITAAILISPLSKLWESNLKMDGLIEWVKENANSGRILIESDSKLIANHSILMEVIPIETGMPVLNEIHLDSSISSPFTRTVRHEISSDPYDISCQLCQKSLSHPDDKNLVLRHLNLFNAKYVIATNENTKNYLNSFLTLIKDADGVYVFESPADGYYEIPKYKPILIVSRLDKWKEFSGEIFLDKDLYNLTFVWSPQIIDDGRFSHAFVLDGNVREFIGNIKKKNLFVENNAKAEITKFEFDDKTINITKEGDDKTPLLIKFSYYPRWKGNTEVYLASPSLMFVFADDNVELEFI